MRAILCIVTLMGCGEPSPAEQDWTNPKSICCTPSLYKCTTIAGPTKAAMCSRCECVTCGLEAVSYKSCRDTIVKCDTMPCALPLCGTERRQLGEWSETIEHGACL